MLVVMDAPLPSQVVSRPPRKEDVDEQDETGASGHTTSRSGRVVLR